jgi:hypothetical protein
VAASATLAYLTTHSTASRADGLVHGYAAAAMWATVLLVTGAAIALTLPDRFEHR